MDRSALNLLPLDREESFIGVEVLGVSPLLSLCAKHLRIEEQRSPFDALDTVKWEACLLFLIGTEKV